MQKPPLSLEEFLQILAQQASSTPGTQTPIKLSVHDFNFIVTGQLGDIKELLVKYLGGSILTSSPIAFSKPVHEN